MNAEMQLVTRAIAGDQDACSEIFRANRDRIYRLCCQILHGPQDAEDLTQETFLAAFSKLKQFRGRSRGFELRNAHCDRSDQNQTHPGINDLAPSASLC